MDRLGAAVAMLLALLMAGCSGDKPLELPTQAIDRAASCGVVAAAEARTAMTDIKKPLPIDAQGRILHYAMVAASESGEFDKQIANSVSQRMPQVEPKITGGKWQTLIPACRAAYPAAEAKEVALPANRTDALLQCDEAASFTLLALENQEAAYGEKLADYHDLKRKLDSALVAGLRARAGASPAAQQKERRKALAKTSSLASPTVLLEQCAKKFG